MQLYTQYGQIQMQESFFQQQQQQQQQQQLQQQQKQQQQQQKGGKVEFGLLATLNEWKTSNPDKAYTVRHQRPFSGNNSNKWQSNRPASGSNQVLPVINPIQPPPKFNATAFQGGKPNNMVGQFPKQKKSKGKRNKKKGGGGGGGGGGGQQGVQKSSKGNKAGQRQHFRK
eukprot:TRINITY_DN19500_c2_g2_i2.p4 TRINITY_DN19500_c2_g2~~TRINITY_DN19500_c2_g2_i2.p4  ORF type:complete len:170 (+),score=32.40 TRINITY_DN19500_c2_g2_i2:483-992(+)